MVLNQLFLINFPFYFLLFPYRTAPSSELAALIEKLQKNADKVEKNIYETEQNLNKVHANTPIKTFRKRVNLGPREHI